MKKFLLSFAAIAAFSTASFAQLSIGVKGGVNASYVTGIEDQVEEIIEGETDAEDFFSKDKRGKLGTQFQLFAEYAFNEAFSAGLGFQYETTGDRTIYSGSEDGLTAEIEANFDNTYIKLPLYAKYQFGTGAIKPYVAVGPYFGFWNSTEYEVELSTNQGFSQKFGFKDFDDIEEGDSYEAKKVDVGATLGLGTTIAAGPGSILVGINYDLGFVDIIAEGRNFDEDIDGKDFSEKNQSLQFNLGYVIPIGAAK